MVFPAESGAEKEGTVTHPDGRLQRVRQSIGHLGEVRPGWWVLAELCERLGAGTGAASSAMVTAAVAEAVPFYPPLEEIGGRGVRWQEREAASSLPDERPSEEPLAEPPALEDGLRIGAAPSLWSGPAVEHSPSLRFLSPEPRAELSPADARRLGVASGDDLELRVNGSSLHARAAVRSGVRAGSVLLTGGPEVEPRPVEVRKA